MPIFREAINLARRLSKGRKHNGFLFVKRKTLKKRMR